MLFKLVILLAVLPYLARAACPTIISRANWGARAARTITSLDEDPAPFVVIHHTATPSCTTLANCKTRVKSIETHHRNVNNWNDIGYNFLIGGDGTVYEGRGWGITGSHMKGYNSKSIGIALIGNFQDTQPPQVYLNALKKLISCGTQHNYIKTNYRLIGHRQGASTTCPGTKLYNVISGWSHFDSSVTP